MIMKVREGDQMKIALDIGHNCYPDTGASYIGDENTMVVDVGKRVVSKLQALGYQVIVVTPTACSSVSDSLWQRVNKANNSGADLYVSLHENAGGGRGTEIWISSESGRSIAENVLKEIVSLGFANRGVKVQGIDGHHLYVLNNTTMTSLLIEGCFVDSQEDMNRFNPESMATAIVKGITGKASSEINTTTDLDGKGSGNPEIKKLQSSLNSLINAGLIVDGISGPATKKAIKKFQSIMGLVVDGIAGKNTWEAIQAIYAKSLIKIGSRGYAVRWMQWRIGAVIDGIFGRNTESFVKKFQGAKGIEQDGIVGPATWKELFK